MTDIVEGQYIAIKGYYDGIPKFGKKVSASDRVSAMTQFDLMDEPYEDVMPYVDNDQLYIFDDEKTGI